MKTVHRTARAECDQIQVVELGGRNVGGNHNPICACQGVAFLYLLVTVQVLTGFIVGRTVGRKGRLQNGNFRFDVAACQSNFGVMAGPFLDDFCGVDERMKLVTFIINMYFYVFKIM
jgi:hypothetical protein